VTWLPDAAAGDTPLDRLFGLRPDLYEPFRAFYAVFWTDRLLDPIVLELCRLRVAQVLGCESEERVRYAPARDAGLSEELVARLAGWPDDPVFTDAQRASLAFAEQFVVDPHGLDDEGRDAVIDHLGVSGLVALCEALALFDGFCRFRTILGVEPPSAVRVVPGPAPATSLG